MKKSLVLLLSLVVIFCGTTYFAQGELLKEKDQVHYTEKVLYGDKSVVEGVTIEANLAHAYQIFWNTLYTIGENPKEETEYLFYPWAFQDYRYVCSGTLGFQLYGTEVMNKSYADEKQETYEGLQIAMKELYDKTPNGAEGSAMVYLKDYMKEYAFIHMLDLPYETDDSTDSYIAYPTYWDNDEVLADIKDLEKTGKNDKRLKELKQYLADRETFQKFFRIPVIEEEVHYIALAKDENGVVVGLGDYHHLGGSSTGNVEFSEDIEFKEDTDYFTFDVYSAFVDGNCYFTFDPYTVEGNLVDISQIPGGYGIYHFTYDEEKAEIDLSNLKMVCPINVEEHITEIRVDGSEKYILLFTVNETENTHNLQVIDREPMTLVDRFTLGDGERYISIWTYEDYMVVVTDKVTVIELNEEGRYVQAFSVDRDIMEERVRISTDAPLDFLGWTAEFDWNGETLVLVDRLLLELDKEHYYHGEFCDFYIAAISERGLLYYGEYECSLDYSNDGYRNPRFNTDMENALTITWE